MGGRVIAALRAKHLATNDCIHDVADLASNHRWILGRNRMGTARVKHES